MANGGLIAPSGIHLVALAAKLHSVSLVVCTGLYKLCPLYPHDQDTFNDLRSPSAILKFEDGNFFSFFCILILF
jgi:translation initiation factor eIF-2B subunit beta